MSVIICGNVICQQFVHPCSVLIQVLLFSLSIDEKFVRLKVVLDNLTLRTCPMKSFGVSPFPRWFTNNLKRLTIQKKISHKRFKNSLNPVHYQEFANLRDACRKLSCESYCSYQSNVEAHISSNPRAFWGLINAQRRSSNMPSCL